MQSIKKSQHRLPLALAAAIFATLMLAIWASASHRRPACPAATSKSTQTQTSRSTTSAVDRLGQRHGDPQDRPADGQERRLLRRRRQGGRHLSGDDTGSIPNNKSDLLNVRRLRRAGAGRSGVPQPVLDPRPGAVRHDADGLRAQQSSTPCANGVNPVRTAGDLLIEYRIEQGGAVANIRVRTWTGSVGPGDTSPLRAATGTINTTPIPPRSRTGLERRLLSPRTFGEACSTSTSSSTGRVRVVRERVPEEPCLGLPSPRS